MVARGPNFEEHEDQFLAQHYRKRGASWCAERLERSLPSVRGRVRKIGVARGTEESPASNDMIDAVIRRAYTGERKHGFVSRCALQVGRTRDWVQKRAMALGVLQSVDQRPWTREEIEFASARAMVPAAALARQMRRHGWHRTPGSIAAMRSADKIERVDPERFTADGLAHAFGVTTTTITQWIKKGWLRAERRGLNREHTKQGDGYVIHEREVVAFVRHHLAHVSLAKLEPNKDWFIDLLVRCGSPRSLSNRQRAAKEAA